MTIVPLECILAYFDFKLDHVTYFANGMFANMTQTGAQNVPVWLCFRQLLEPGQR